MIGIRQSNPPSERVALTDTEYPQSFSESEKDKNANEVVREKAS